MLLRGGGGRVVRYSAGGARRLLDYVALGRRLNYTWWGGDGNMQIIETSLTTTWHWRVSELIDTLSATTLITAQRGKIPRIESNTTNSNPII